MNWQSELGKTLELIDQGNQLLKQDFPWVEVKIESKENLIEVLKKASASNLIVLSNRRRKLESAMASWLDSNKTSSSGCIFLDFSSLSKVLEHTVEDQVISVETGIQINELNKYLEKTNQWLPCHGFQDDSTILDLIETGDSGPLATGYGGARNLVLGLETVLSSGTNIRSGGKIVKNVTGYDLTKLFVGSASWLGISHLVHLRLFAKPQSSRALFLPIAKSETIPNLVRNIFELGFPVSSLDVFEPNLLSELLEELSNSKIKLPVLKNLKEHIQSQWQSRDDSAFVLISSHGYEEELEPAFESFQNCYFELEGKNKSYCLDNDTTDRLLKEFTLLSRHKFKTNIQTNMPFDEAVKIFRLLKIDFPDLLFSAMPVIGACTFHLPETSQLASLEAKLFEVLEQKGIEEASFAGLSVVVKENLFSRRSLTVNSLNHTKLNELKSSIKDKFDKTKTLNPLISY